MRVVITGGTGLIGGALADALVGSGHDVVIPTRSPGRRRLAPAGARLVPWDGVASEPLVEWVDGAHAVVNLAGEGLGDKRWSSAQKKRIEDSRSHAGRAVTAAVEAAQARPALVVQISGAGYYGTLDPQPLDESAPPGDDFLARVCVAWEAGTAGVTGLGVRQVVVRTAVVLSPEGGALRKMLPVYRLGIGGRLGSGEQWMSWVHLADAVAAIRFLMDKEDAAGVYNISAPGAVTNAEFVRALGKALGRPTFIPVPAFSVKLLFGEMSMTVLEGQRVVPTRLLDSGFGFRFPDVGLALEDLLG